MARGVATRDRILSIAEQSVLAKGFEATSVEEIVAAAGISRSGFFYHFPDKNRLALALLQRYVAANDRIFDEVFARGRELSADPLQAFLIGLKLLAERMAQLHAGHPGCLIASVCYQERLFDRQVTGFVAGTVQAWHDRFLADLTAIAATSAPRTDVSLSDLADMLSCVIDGGIILEKTLAAPGRVAQQVLAYRDYVRLIFSPR